MDYLKFLFVWSKDLHPILQGVIGSALFAFTLWFGRVSYKAITDNFKSIKKSREVNEVSKYIFHKYYVNSNGMFYFTQGYLYVIFRSLEYFMKSFLIFIIGYAVSVTPFGNIWVTLITAYFSFQYLFEGLSWIKPTLSKGDINKYDPDIVNKIKESLIDERRKEIFKSMYSEDISDLEKIKNQINELEKKIKKDSST